MIQPIFDEQDFVWASMLQQGQIRIMPDGHVRETMHGGCTDLCPRCNPKLKDKLPLIIHAVIIPNGVA